MKSVLLKVFGFFKDNYYLASSVLIFLSFPSSDIWFMKGYPFFAWISLVPLFIFIRGKKIGEVYFYSFVTGLIANFLTYRWIGNFAGKIDGGYALIVSMLIPFITVFFASRFFIAEFLSRKFEGIRFILFPSVWILVDWVLSIGYLAFPWTYWGYSQYQFTSFIQISSVTGILGIDFMLIAGNYILSDLIRGLSLGKSGFRGIRGSAEFRRMIVFVSIFIVITAYGKILLVGNEVGTKRDLRVSVVQSCISPWEQWNENKFIYLNELMHYTQKSLADKPDLIVWSESATLETISFNYEMRIKSPFDEKIYDLVKSSNVSLLTGEIGVYEDHSGGSITRYPQNNAVLIANGKVIKTYPKINLVPFGEWFPYEKWLPSVKKIATRYGGSDFIPGKSPMLFDVKDKNFGALICYEGIFYQLCREFKNRGADFFVNITNDGWTDTFNGHMQHFSASIFRAVENGIWYVRAGNTGYSVLIDPYGRIVKSMPILEKGYLTGDLDFSMNRNTLYSKFGDIFLYMNMIFLLIVAFRYVYQIITTNPEAKGDKGVGFSPSSDGL